MDNNISKVTEVNKRIDKDINDFKLYVQQKYNKKYTDLAYGNIKNAKYYQGLGELSMLRDIAVLSDDFFDHTKDNFKELSEGYLQAIRERDDLKAEVIQLKDRLADIEKPERTVEIKNSPEIHKPLPFSERNLNSLTSAIEITSTMKKATPAFLKGFAYSLEDTKRINNAIDAIVNGYTEAFMNEFPENTYELSRTKIYNIILNEVVSKSRKIPNELLNDKNVIDIYKNNFRNIEELLLLDAYVVNPEKLDMQNNLIQIKKYGAMALKSALVENVFTDKLFESLYEDIIRQINHEEGRPDETLSHLYDSEECHEEQEFLKELIVIEPVYVDHTGTGFLVFNDNDNKFLPDRIDIKSTSSAISFAHTVSTFLEKHKDDLATLLTDMNSSKEAIKTQIDRAVFIYKHMELNIKTITEKVNKEAKQPEHRNKNILER